ncbi:unnamed protein product [Amoebophrya sp. A25]|nr:unnamed protein product [Amoebophrya sp. A25]|eukprot:GSA25T00019134001.1
MQVLLHPGQEIEGDLLGRFQENFRLLDTNKDGKLSHKEVGILFRAFGQNPTDDDLKGMLQELPQLVEFDLFLTFFRKNYRPPIGEDVLVQAFQVFDVKDKGVLNVEKFKDVMASLGEPLPVSQITEIMNEVEVDEQGNFDYVELAKTLVQGPKGLPTN